MLKTIVTMAAFGALSAASFGLAGTATAVPLGGTSASDTVSSLKSQGYLVQINGSVNSSGLSRCTVTNVSGLTDVSPVPPGTTAFVDVDCLH